MGFLRASPFAPLRRWTLLAALTLLLGGDRIAFAVEPWTGTWAASPTSSTTTFAQQTLRQIVHTSISGSAARVQLSNAFGTQAVTIADVHIAERSSGSTIVAASDRPVTFGGQATTTIAAGDIAISDSVAFPVGALADVAVSIYLPSATGPATSHGLGEQTNYIVAGDVSGSATLTNPQTTGSYYFLANVDVQTSIAARAVVTLGASITDGYASTSDANRRWPNDLATRLAGSGRTVGVLDQGISGNRLLADGSGQSALNRFARDVLAQPGVAWVIFSDDPINDLGSSSPPPSSAQLIAAMGQLVSDAHQKGLAFLCSTLTPYEGASYWTAQGETEREAINAFIRGTTSGCDGIIDQDTATHDPAAPTKYLAAYDSGDHLHPNDAGYQAIADAVDLTLFDLATSGDAGAGGDAGASVDAGADASPSGTIDAGAKDGGAAGQAKDAAADGTAATGGGSGRGGGGGGCSTAPATRSSEGAAAFLGLVLVMLAGRWRARQNRGVSLLPCAPGASRRA